MKQIGVVLGLIIAVIFAFAATSYADTSETLWYGGDMDHYNGLLNTVNSSWARVNVYDDFVVDGDGWTVNSVWSNNAMDYLNVNQALWEIRSNVSNGNAGTLIAGGTSLATQTPTGRSGFNYTEYTIKVSGLNVELIPGRYWLTVAPVGFGTGASFIPTTSGENAVPDIPGNNTNSYFYEINSLFPGNDKYFTPIGTGNNNYPYFDFTHRDFSMGVGTVVPEPVSMLLFGIGGAAMAMVRRRRKS